MMMTDKPKKPSKKDLKIPGTNSYPKYVPVTPEEHAKNLTDGQKRAMAHPGGENLVLFKDRASSVEAREKSQATKAKRRAEIKELGLFVKALDSIGYEVSGQAPKGLDVLKLLMVKAMQSGDDVEAGRLAAMVAEYEAPKLTRRDVVTTAVDVKDLTDDELATALQQLKVVEHVEESND
jgi:hypothetical protein